MKRIPSQPKSRTAEYSRFWREKNRDHCLARDRAWHAKNRRGINSRRRKAYASSPILRAKKQATSRAWKLRNKARTNAYQNNRIKRLRETDPAFRAMWHCRTRLRQVLGNRKKLVTTKHIVGCTPAELAAHIERQFLPGMTWSNNTVRGWHIDHIKPCHEFDFSDPKQAGECFHFSNLRPLWSKDNLSRHGKSFWTDQNQANEAA